jgi:hypothetical protein
MACSIFDKRVAEKAALSARGFNGNGSVFDALALLEVVFASRPQFVVVSLVCFSHGNKSQFAAS